MATKITEVYGTSLGGGGGGTPTEIDAGIADLFDIATPVQDTRIPDSGNLPATPPTLYATISNVTLTPPQFMIDNGVQMIHGFAFEGYAHNTDTNDNRRVYIDVRVDGVSKGTKSYDVGDNANTWLYFTWDCGDVTTMEAQGPFEYTVYMYSETSDIYFSNVTFTPFLAAGSFNLSTPEEVVSISMDSTMCVIDSITGGPYWMSGYDTYLYIGKNEDTNIAYLTTASGEENTYTKADYPSEFIVGPVDGTLSISVKNDNANAGCFLTALRLTYVE